VWAEAGRGSLRAERVVCAPEPACRETCDLLGFQPAVDEGLRGWDLGSWAGRTLDEVAAEQPDEVGTWLADPAAAPHGGEPLTALVVRARRWLERAQPGHTLAVCSPAIAWAAVVAVLDARIPPSGASTSPDDGNGPACGPGRWTVRATGVPPPHGVRIAVVGAGVVGMSTTAALLDAGHQVDCFESGAIMGERSAGATRIFRFAHVDPELVRLAQRAKVGFGRWSEEAGRPMLVDSECVITGTDAADRAAAMAEAGANYEVVAAGSGRLRLPVREEPARRAIDVGGGVVNATQTRLPHPARRVCGCSGRTAGIHPGDATVVAAGRIDEYDALSWRQGLNDWPDEGGDSHAAVAGSPPAPTSVEATALLVDRQGPDGPTHQHQDGPGAVGGGHVDPGLTGGRSTEGGDRCSCRSSRAQYLAADPSVAEFRTTGIGGITWPSGPVPMVGALMRFARTGSDLRCPSRRESGPLTRRRTQERAARGATFRGAADQAGVGRARAVRRRVGAL
jgi:sarcosine oxidase